MKNLILVFFAIAMLYSCKSDEEKLQNDLIGTWQITSSNETAPNRFGFPLILVFDESKYCLDESRATCYSYEVNNDLILIDTSWVFKVIDLRDDYLKIDIIKSSWLQVNEYEKL